MNPKSKEIEREASSGVHVTKINYSPETGFSMDIEGAPFPYPTLPSAEVIASVVVLKRMYMELGRILSSWYFLPSYPLILLATSRFLKLILDSTNRVGYGSLSPYVNYLHIGEYRELTPVARSVGKMTRLFLGNLGLNRKSFWKTESKESHTISWITALIVSHIVEFDGAYRMRIQDFFETFPKQTLIKNPRKCINQFRRELYLREKDRNTARKVANLLFFLSFLLLVPKIKRSFKLAVASVDYGALTLSEGDLYWYYQSPDYNIKGISPQNRRIIMSGRGWVPPSMEGIKV